MNAEQKREHIFQLIRSFGYTTSGQTSEIVDALMESAAGVPDSERDAALLKEVFADPCFAHLHLTTKDKIRAVQQGEKGDDHG